MSNVLLIEPDRILGQTFGRALSHAGHKVVVCATAQSAVLAADQISPDVIVLELQLVAHSGVEFLYEFRSYADWQQVPVVVHSNVPQVHIGKELAEIRRQLGIVEYLYKPQTNMNDLLQAVAHAAAAVA